MKLQELVFNIKMLAALKCTARFEIKQFLSMVDIYGFRIQRTIHNNTMALFKEEKGMHNLVYGLYICELLLISFSLHRKFTILTELKFHI